MTRRASFVLLLALPIIAGCSKSIAPATGQFVYADGSPAKELDGFEVIFEGKAPDGRTYGSTGLIDSEGRFTMATVQPGDGAPIGSCRILISPKNGKTDREAPYPLDKKFRSFETSKLTAEITAAGPNDFKLTVEKKK